MKPGDIVKLKSGGPSMTVEKVGTVDSAAHTASCVWFNDEGDVWRLYRDSFAVDVLDGATATDVVG